MGLGLSPGVQSPQEPSTGRVGSSWRAPVFGAGRAAEQPGLSEPKQLLCFGLLGRGEQQQRAEELFQQVGLGS